MFELTAQQLPLLERAQARHGSKRAALLAALLAEASTAEAREQRATDDDELRAAREQLLQLERELARTTAELKKARARIATDTEARSEAKKRARELVVERKRAQGAEAQADQLRRETRELTDTLEEVEDSAFEALFCSRCGRWAEADEWAYAEDGDGERCYHRGCGDHGPGLLCASWLAWRLPR